MRPLEVAEQIFMIAIMLAWLVWILGFVSMPWFTHVLYYGTPPPLIAILVLRVLRYRQALRDAEATPEQRGRFGGPGLMR
jgi:hypothetical protein